jgi:hypothetical protein
VGTVSKARACLGVRSRAVAAPKFAPVEPLDRTRGYESPPHVPDPWTADRPAEIDGRQPTGARLGFQGPDQGYALTLAARVRPEVQAQPGESVDDAIAGCTAIALRRASLYGRAPVMPDVRIALTIWGFFDANPPGDLVGVRGVVFEGVADTLHHYEERRALVDSVPEATLRRTLDDVRAAYPADWRSLLGR